MLILDLTLPTPAENLALDEALLLAAERDAAHESARLALPGDGETLRLWESPQPLVVLGRASRGYEANLEACRRRGVPIVRRASGGAAVMAGPGCLMYAVVLSYRLRPELRCIDAAHRLVLGRLAAALAPLVPGVRPWGISDLAFALPDQPPRKFSGNSLRCRGTHLLYHGTLLYDFPLQLLSECLAHPPREPDYRAGRPHAAFVANLPGVDAAALRQALLSAWDHPPPAASWPRELTAHLAASKYALGDWAPRE